MKDDRAKRAVARNDERDFMSVLSDIFGPNNIGRSVDETLLNLKDSTLSAYMQTRLMNRRLRMKSHLKIGDFFDRNPTVFDFINLEAKPLHEIETTNPSCTFVVVFEDKITLCDLSKVSSRDIFVKCRHTDDLTHPTRDDVFLEEWYLKISSEFGNCLIPLTDVSLLFSHMRNSVACTLSSIKTFAQKIMYHIPPEKTTCYPILFYEHVDKSVQVSQLILVQITRDVNIFDKSYDITSGTHCSNTMNILRKGYAVRVEPVKSSAGSDEYYEHLQPRKREMDEELKGLADEEREHRRHKRFRGLPGLHRKKLIACDLLQFMRS